MHAHVILDSTPDIDKLIKAAQLPGKISWDIQWIIRNRAIEWKANKVLKKQQCEQSAYPTSTENWGKTGLSRAYTNKQLEPLAKAASLARSLCIYPSGNVYFSVNTWAVYFPGAKQTAELYIRVTRGARRIIALFAAVSGPQLWRTEKFKGSRFGSLKRVVMYADVPLALRISTFGDFPPVYILLRFIGILLSYIYPRLDQSFAISLSPNRTNVKVIFENVWAVVKCCGLKKKFDIALP